MLKFGPKLTPLKRGNETSITRDSMKNNHRKTLRGLGKKKRTKRRHSNSLHGEHNDNDRPNFESFALNSIEATTTINEGANSFFIFYKCRFFISIFLLKKGFRSFLFPALSRNSAVNRLNVLRYTVVVYYIEVHRYIDVKY